MLKHERIKGVNKIKGVKDGEVVVGKVVSICMTFDHRFADGAQGALVLRRLQKIFANPEGFPDVFSEKDETTN